MLRHLNAQDTRELSDSMSRGPGTSIPPPDFHKYTRLRVGVVEQSRRGSRLSLRLRGALHDQADPSIEHRPISSMELLAVEASTPTDRLAPRIDEAVLFAQRALSPSNWISSRKSWMIEAIARRGGVIADSALHVETRGGLGWTVELPAQTYAYALGTIAGVGICCGDAALAPGVEVGFALQAFRRWRAGIRWIREHSLNDWANNQERLKAWIRLDLGQRLGILMIGEKDPMGDHVKFGLDWYP